MAPFPTLVREHGPKGDVAGALDIRRRGVELAVDYDAALSGQFQ